MNALLGSEPLPTGIDPGRLDLCCPDASKTFLRHFRLWCHRDNRAEARSCVEEPKKRKKRVRI